MIALPFVVNLVANLGFIPFFSGLRNIPLSAVDILIVWATIIWCTVAIWPHYRWVGLAQGPYFLGSSGNLVADRLIAGDFVFCGDERSQLALSTMTGMVSRMRKAGLVTVEADATDSRVLRLQLTPLASLLKPRSRQLARKVERFLSQLLRQPEQQNLRDSRSRITKMIADELRTTRKKKLQMECSLPQPPPPAFSAWHPVDM